MINTNNTLNTIDLIVKDNSLIEARCKLDLYESRILAWCVAQIGRYDDSFKMYKLKRLDAIRILNLAENTSLNQIRDLLRKMHRHVIKIKNPKLDLGKDGWIDVSLITKSQYNSNTEEFSFSISDDLKPYLIELTKGYFTKLDFFVVLRFKNLHSFRFYEICKKELMQYSEVIFEKDLNELKKLLGIPGKYKKYKDFRRWIIDPVIKELRDIANMELEIIPSRLMSRDYRVLQFSVKMLNPNKSGQWMQMKSIGLTDKKISELLDEYGNEVIKETLEKHGSQLIAKKFENGTEIKNPGGMFISKIKKIASETQTKTYISFI